MSTKDDASQQDLMHALHKAIYISGFLVIGGSCRITSSSQVAAAISVPVFFEVVALFFAGSESDAYLLEG